MHSALEQGVICGYGSIENECDNGKHSLMKSSSVRIQFSVTLV